MECIKWGVVRTHRGRVVMWVGLSGGILVVAGIFFVFHLLTSLSPEEAKERVRLCLQWEISQRHMAILEEKGVKTPDLQTATRWKEEMDQVNRLQLVSIKLRRTLPDIFFHPATPTYVVRVVLLDDKGKSQARYFWIAWEGMDREISKLAWYFSI